MKHALDRVSEKFSAYPTLRVVSCLQAAEVTAIIADVSALCHDGSPLNKGSAREFITSREKAVVCESVTTSLCDVKC